MSLGVVIQGDVSLFWNWLHKKYISKWQAEDSICHVTF